MPHIFHPERKSKCFAHSYFGDMWDGLPEKVKNYICDISQRCDPTGEVQMNACLIEQRDALVQKNLELKATLKEYMIRTHGAFPETESEMEMWDQQLNPSMMQRFFEAAGIGFSQIPGYPYRNS